MKSLSEVIESISKQKKKKYKAEPNGNFRSEK